MFHGINYYWINRKEDHARKQFMESWLSSIQESDVYRVEAITPLNLPALKIPKNYEGFNSEVELACLSSHIKAIATAYKDECEYAVILEDDVISPYEYSLPLLIKSAPDDWDILQLVICNQRILNKYFTLFKDHKLLWQIWDSHNWSSASYLINRKGMKRILDFFAQPESSADSSDMASIDLTGIVRYRGFIADYALFRYVNTYTSTIPLVFFNADFGSTLHNRHIANTLIPANQNIIKIYSLIDKLAENNNYSHLVPYILRRKAINFRLQKQKSKRHSFFKWLRQKIKP